jgi:hypothetical protein
MKFDAAQTTTKTLDAIKMQNDVNHQNENTPSTSSEIPQIKQASAPGLSILVPTRYEPAAASRTNHQNSSIKSHHKHPSLSEPFDSFARTCFFYFPFCCNLSFVFCSRQSIRRATNENNECSSVARTNPIATVCGAKERSNDDRNNDGTESETNNNNNINASNKAITQFGRCDDNDGCKRWAKE